MNMSGDQLITLGDTCIKNLNIRDGIQAYKQARTNKGSLEIVIPKLFHAYALRYQQLNDQKMTKEAAVVLSMGVKLFSDISVINPAVLKDCILFFPVQKTMEIYKHHSKTNPPLPEIEKQLGNRLVADDSLYLAQELTDGSRLKSDLGYIQTAVPHKPVTGKKHSGKCDLCPEIHPILI
jgi:hypothetical protein